MDILVFFVLIGIIISKIINGTGKNKKKNFGAPPTVSVNPVRNRAENANQQTFVQTRPSVEQQRLDEKPEENSTMAYLNEKARQDEIEHAREKQEEAQRLRRNYGGIRVAERLYEGSLIPEGRKCCVCGYCGAENLLPMMPRERYSCYFCREPLN